MKVPLVKKHCLLRRGGSQRYCFNLARVLMIARGREVTVISRSMDAELRDELAFVSPRFLRGPSWQQHRMMAEWCGAAASERPFDTTSPELQEACCATRNHMWRLVA